MQKGIVTDVCAWQGILGVRPADLGGMPSLVASLTASVSINTAVRWPARWSRISRLSNDTPTEVYSRTDSNDQPLFWWLSGPLFRHCFEAQGCGQLAYVNPCERSVPPADWTRGLCRPCGKN